MHRLRNAAVARRGSSVARLLVCAGLLLAGVAFLPACSYLYPEPEPESEPQRPRDKPLFDDDPAYYAQNAKDYFDQGQYARARTQWENQLKIQKDDWMAKLGLASCDYFLGSQALDRRDIQSGRELLAKAESQARELWNGQIEDDTFPTLKEPVRQWAAALIVARSLRGIADADDLQARILADSVATMAASPTSAAETKRAELEAQRARFAKQSEENRKASLKLFERLLAMKNPSEDVILNTAELYVMSERVPEAEKLFLQYLEVAEGTRKQRAEEKARMAEEQRGDPKGTELALQFLDDKLASNAAKQTSVLVRLGNIHYDRAENSKKQGSDSGHSEKERRAATQKAQTHYSNALDYLERARELSPERTDIYVKIAQCQGQLGLYEAAIDNLDRFIRESAERVEPFDENLRRAYQLKSEFQLKLAERRK